jgi:hypothetical protein
VAISPEGGFVYPIGAEGSLKLGYDPAWLALVPSTVVSRFVGVEDPFSIRAPKPGDSILDAGCGCGTKQPRSGPGAPVTSPAKAANEPNKHRSYNVSEAF